MNHENYCWVANPQFHVIISYKAIRNMSQTYFFQILTTNFFVETLGITVILLVHWGYLALFLYIIIQAQGYLGLSVILNFIRVLRKLYQVMWHYISWHISSCFNQFTRNRTSIFSFTCDIYGCFYKIRK